LVLDYQKNLENIRNRRASLRYSASKVTRNKKKRPATRFLRSGGLEKRNTEVSLKSQSAVNKATHLEGGAGIGGRLEDPEVGSVPMGDMQNSPSGMKTRRKYGRGKKSATGGNRESVIAFLLVGSKDGK